MRTAREIAEELKKQRENSSLGSARDIAQMLSSYDRDAIGGVNNEYINSFVNDANAYFKALNNAYTGLNWSNANDTTDSITKQWEALEKRKNTIGVWLLNNKDKLDTESYNSLAESIKNLSQGGADSVKSFKDANALYSSFASQGDYDKWYSNYTAKQNEINSVLNADDFEKYSGLGDSAEYYTPWYLGLGQSLNSDDLKYVKVNGKEEKFNQYTLKQKFDAVATDEEKKLYNYYLGKYGAEKALQYLEGVAEDVNYRRGQQIFDKIKDNTLAQLGYSAVAGLDSFASGLGNVGKSVIGLFKDGEQKPLPTTAIQYASGMVRDDLANEGFKIGKQSISQIAYDLGNTTANQIPSMAIGVMTSPVVGAILMGTSAGGNAYKEMKDLGYTDGQATTYGMITGVLEGVLGNILGSISGIGKNLLGKTAMKSLAKGVNSAAFRAALNFGSEMVSEGIEEGLQEVLSPFIKAIATGDEFEGVDWSEVGYSAVLGALSAGMLNSVSSIPGTVGTLNTANEIKKANKVDELKQIANTYAPETVAYKIADKVKADTGAFGIARLLYEVNGRLTAQNTTDIREALKDSGYVDKDADTVAEWLAKAVEGQPLTRKQQIALENNPIITKVFADIVLDETSIVNQRTADVGRINDTKVEKKSEKTEAVNEDTVPERGEEAQQTPETVEVENEAEIVDDRSRESLLLALQSTDYDELTKNMLADAYDGNYSIGEYLTAAREGYDYGLVGLENESIPTDGLYKSVLSPSQQKTSYELGVAKAKGVAQTRARNVASNKKYGANKTGRRKGTVSGANISLSQMRAKFNDQQNRAYKVISRISEATGIDVVFYSSKADAEGRYNGAQGKFTWKNDTIYVDINSGLLFEANATDLANYTMLRTFTHEFVHFIEKNNAEGYNELRRVVFKTLSERGENPDELITNTIAEYGFEDNAYDRASREVVAEALAEILPDSNFVEQLAMENPNVFRRLLEQLKQFIADIKDYFSEMGKVNYRGAEGLKTEVDGTVKYLENIVELFDKVAVGAVENYQAQFDDGVNGAINLLAESGIGVDDETNSVYSLRYAFGRKDAEGNAMDVVTVGKKNFDVEKVAELVSKVTGRSLEDSRKWVNTEISLANIVMTYPEFLDFEADDRFEAIKKNSDYPQGTVDLSNLCPKRAEYTAIFDKLQKTYPDRLFKAEELAEIRKLLQSKKITVACGACFVEDRRQLLGEIAGTFIDMWKTAVETGKPLTKINAEGKPVQLSVTAALAKKYGISRSETITASDNYIPTQYDLTTYEGFRRLQEDHPLIAMGYERYNNSRGQQAGRLIEGRAEYNHQILGWSAAKVKSVNNNGGLRIFSFSDFEVVHLLDIVQVIIDCAAMGVKIQGYTKIPAFAKLIRNTGIKLNRSLIPKGDTGIKVVNGKEVLDIDTVEGIDINDKDFMDEADNPDVGNIIIGINPKQIGIAMLDDFIDYIIPFHTNKSNAVCKKLGVGAWVNYKESQHEKDIETGKASKHNVNIYTEVIDKYHPANKVEFVNAFLEECRRQKKIPRYAEFLNKEYTEDGIYTDEGGSFNYTYREGYHKFPIDFKMFDKNGNTLPQKNIVPDLDEGVIKEITDAEVKRKQSYEFPEDVYREIDSIFGKASTTPNDQIEQGDDEVVQEQKRNVNNNKTTYDYTKPFSEQIDDYTHNLIPKNDTLLVGETPIVWKQVGFNSLPITINQRHVEYALNGTKDYDHHIGEAMLKSLPDLIKDPVAIIQSQSPTRNDRIVVILNMIHNGSNIIGAIEVDGEGIINHISIDSNALTSLFSKQNAIAQLHTALTNTVNGGVELFYWNKKQARALLQNKGLQLPKTLPQDGFVYSIHHNRSNVKPKFRDVTESKQFKRWFGDWQNKPKSSSKVVNANGTPKLVYHYTNNEFTTFDATKNGTNQGQSHGDGIYLSTSQSAYNYAGKHKMVLYANIKKPFEMNLTRKQADYILKKYASIKHDLDAYGSMYYKHAIAKLMSPSRVFDYLKEYAGDNSINVSDILKDLGYDGIHDGNVWVAFDSNQVKSATDNIGTFDADNSDIRYQLRTKPLTDTEVLRMAMDRLDTDEYTESEKVTIKSLNEKLDKLAELEAQRTELGKLYKEQQFGKDGDRNEAIKTYNRMQILDKRIASERGKILKQSDVLESKTVSKVSRIVKSISKINQKALDEENFITALDKKQEKFNKILENSQKKQQAQFDKILDETRETVAKEQRKLDEQKYREAKERQSETAQKSKYREIIRADVNELVKWLTKPDDKKGNRIPDVIKNPIISILRSIDTSSPRLFKGNPVKATKDYRENLKKLQSAFQGEIDAGKLYSGYLDLPEGFMDDLKNMINEADTLRDYSREGVNIAEGLNVALAELNQLKVWAKFLNEIKQWVTKTDKLLANSIFQHVSDAADTTINDLMKQKDAGKKTGELYKFFNWTQPRASWIWERFGEGGKAIEKGFIDAQSKLAKNTKAITDFREKTYTQKEAQKWINEINTVKLHGNEIQMPTSYLMGLYLLSKQEDSVRHLTNGGFRVGTFTRKGKKYYDNTEHSFGSVQELNSFLDEYFSAEKFAREREVADQIQSFMAKQGAEWGNYVSVARFGEKRFTNPDYYPINSDGKLLESTVDEMPSGADLYALLNMSFTKARNEKATNRLIVYDMFDVFSNHVSAMAQYNAFALPILDALKWFNYKSDISSVRDEIRRVFGAPEEGGKGSGKEGFAETFVKNIIRAYSGTEAMGTAVDEMGMRGLRLHNMAQIAYNFRVVVQQPLSIIRAGAVLNSKYLLKAIKTPLPTTLESTSEMLDHSGTAVWKDLGFYDINISRGVADIIKGADNWRDKISDVGMRGAKFADDVAWTTMWNACKAQVEAQNSSLARGSDEYWAKVNELFDEVIYKTQVVDTVLTKSEFMRNKGFWSRAMSSFMSEPIASYSMCMGEFDKFNADVKRGLPWNEAFKRNAKSIAKTTAIYSISAIMLSAVTAAMDAARDDDEYEELSEKWWDAFRGNLIDELVPLNKLPIFSDLYEILKILLSKMGVDTYGNPPQSIFAQWYDSLVKGVEILYDKISGEDTNYTYYGGIYKLLQAASSIVGLPIAPLTREVITAWNNTIGRIDPKYKVKTYDSGDLSNIKYAFKDGKLTEDEAIKHILDKGLADNSTIGAENEAYFMVQGWEYGEGYSRYDKLYSAAIDGDGSYYQAIAELTSHGYEEKKIRTALQTELSRRFKSGTVSWTTAYLVLTQYCDKTKEDAEKLLYNWENA